MHVQQYSARHSTYTILIGSGRCNLQSYIKQFPVWSENSLMDCSFEELFICNWWTADTHCIVVVVVILLQCVLLSCTHRLLSDFQWSTLEAGGAGIIGHHCNLVVGRPWSKGTAAISLSPWDRIISQWNVIIFLIWITRRTKTKLETKHPRSFILCERQSLFSWAINTEVFLLSADWYVPSPPGDALSKYSRSADVLCGFTLEDLPPD